MYGLYRTALLLSTALLTNLLFLLVNIPFVFVLISFPFALEHSLFYAAAMIPMGPAFASAFGVLGRYLRLEQSQPFKEFFVDYWRNFKSGILFWILALPVGYMFFVNFFAMFASQNGVGMVFFALAFAVWIMLIINALTVLSRFTVGVVVMIRASFLMLFRHPLRTFSAFSVISICVALLALWPAYTFVVVFGLFALGVMYYLNPVLDILEKEFLHA